MKNSSPFQIILMVASGILIIVAVIMFALMRSKPQENFAPITMWGTMSKGIFQDLGQRLKSEYSIDIDNVNYEQKDSDQIYKEFTVALAEGRAPDLIMLSQDQIVSNEAKLQIIPFDTYPVSSFLDTFIEEGEMYFKEEGILALPFSVDPLVMYWDRTAFNRVGITQPPKLWSEILTLAPKLITKDSSFNITESAVALGEFDNVNHAKEIFMTLLMQAGNDVVLRNSSDKDINITQAFKVILSERLGFNIPPAQAALNFYTQFANPNRDVYSWNRSLPNSLDRFLSGDLAIYFGFASEYPEIRQRNPNLNFGVATIPQSKSGDAKKTFGKMQALAISRSSSNPSVALAAMYKLTGPEAQTILSNITGLPSVRRDLLVEVPNDQNKTVFNTSAVWAKAVLEIDPEATESIFETMVESFTTGQVDAIKAVGRAEQELNLLIN